MTESIQTQETSLRQIVQYQVWSCLCNQTMFILSSEMYLTRVGRFRHNFQKKKNILFSVKRTFFSFQISEVASGRTRSSRGGRSPRTRGSRGRGRGARGRGRGRGGKRGNYYEEEEESSEEEDEREEENIEVRKIKILFFCFECIEEMYWSFSCVWKHLNTLLRFTVMENLVMDAV